LKNIYKHPGMSKPLRSGLTGSRKERLDFDQIKRATDIVRVIESYGIALRAAGADHVGLCPFHEDRNPSLRVTAAKGLFRCPVCGATGNVIQFVARKENLTDREAALKLCTSIPGVVRGSELVRAARAETAGKKKPAPPVVVDEATRSRLLARVVKFYAKALHKDRAGLEYLAARKLADGALLEAFQVGYCNGSMRRALPRGGEVIAQLKAIGILNERGNETFYKRVVVPIFAEGEVVGLYGRRLDDAEPRHLYLSSPHRGVFNAAAAKAHQTLIVTEAIFDSMSLWVAGHRNAVPLYGKDGWTADHEKLIAENGITEIVLALDNDPRGQEAADALEIKLRGLVPTIRRVPWPEGVKDANAFLLSRDAAAFAALLAPEPEAAAPQVETPSVPEGEAIEMKEGGFAALYGCRRYELCAIERPSAAKLRATVKALNGTPGRFHIDTVDFYLSRSRRGFVSEAARTFRETSEVIETDVNRLIVQLENYVAQRLEEKSPTVALVAEADQHEAQRFGRSHDLVAEIQSDLERLGLVGERTNRLLLYFAMTSRKMDDPLAVQILSGSGAGKSHLQDAVLSLCPAEELIKLTSLTGQALFYKGEDSLRHKCLAIAEVAGAEGARYALRNLISEKKLVIESTIKNALTGRLETQLNTVHGPTAVFETTTNPDTDPETKSRYLLLSVDESAEQTRAILEMQRQSHTLDGMKRRRRRDAVRLRHHAFQRMLRPLVVVNPFEPLLRYGEDGRLLFRRDHPKYLQLILVVTFLHQMQRDVKHDEEIGDYIETTLDDIAIANDLGAELFGQSLDDLSAPSRDLLRLIRAHVQEMATLAKIAPEKIEFSRRELLRATGWSYYQLRVHLAELAEHEYIAPMSGRFGQRFVYRLLTLAEETRLTPGLKTVEQLRREAKTLRPCDGSENLAKTLRGKRRKVASPAEADKHSVNGTLPLDLAGAGGELISGGAS
jgi:DNA primase